MRSLPCLEHPPDYSEQERNEIRAECQSYLIPTKHNTLLAVARGFDVGSIVFDSLLLPFTTLTTKAGLGLLATVYLGFAFLAVGLSCVGVYYWNSRSNLKLINEENTHWLNLERQHKELQAELQSLEAENIELEGSCENQLSTELRSEILGDSSNEAVSRNLSEQLAINTREILLCYCESFFEGASFLVTLYATFIINTLSFMPALGAQSTAMAFLDPTVLSVVAVGLLVIGLVLIHDSYQTRKATLSQKKRTEFLRQQNKADIKTYHVRFGKNRTMQTALRCQSFFSGKKESEPSKNADPVCLKSQ